MEPVLKKEHASEVPSYEGRLGDLVEFIVGKLRYDKGVEFHALLARRYEEEAQKEAARGREKLTKALHGVAESEKSTTTLLQKVWDICEPYTK